MTLNGDSGHKTSTNQKIKGTRRVNPPMLERLVEQECDLIDLKLSGLFVDIELAAVRAAIDAT